MGQTKIVGIDLFCGVGGLTYGLQRAGIKIVAGVDLDKACKYPFEHNNDARFIKKDIRKVSGFELSSLYPKGSIRLLAGCAPCQPFSTFRHGEDNSSDSKWNLLRQFSRLVEEIKPELVTMENVVGIASQSVFKNFVDRLTRLGYSVDWASVYCPTFGIPQQRRRLVLVASTLGPVQIPKGHVSPKKFKTVKDVIKKLPRVRAGKSDRHDKLHCAPSLTDINMRRIRASKPGGTWRQWPKDLRAKCHQRATGKSFASVYARMSWNKPSPTITTQAYNFGTGRFGHPDQDRALTLREAALLQTFPRRYQLVPPKKEVEFTPLGRLIGNAVPPRLAYYVGKALVVAAKQPKKKRKKR